MSLANVCRSRRAVNGVLPEERNARYLDLPGPPLNLGHFTSAAEGETFGQDQDRLALAFKPKARMQSPLIQYVTVAPAPCIR